MRILVMLYGVLSYLLFFATFVYFIAFVGDIFVPKTLSNGGAIEGANALLINIGLILLWGIQHSVMARGWFKDAIASLIPHHIERSTYVLASSIVLLVLMHFWQPMDAVIWQVDNPLYQQVLWTLFAIGWLMVLLSTFLTDHFDLFGLRQTWLYFVNKSYSSVNFTERLIYRWIRHPMMLGLFFAFWAVPTMTSGHLVFSIGMSVYILIGIYFEEKSLIAEVGPAYQEYQSRTARIIPKIY